nr:hypothetical protein [Tanacetum cinerariifolium]
MSDLYDVKISVRSSVKLLPEIKRFLSMKPNRERLFRDTVFGPWLDIQSHENDSHMMHYVFQHQVYVSNLLPDFPPFIFHMGDHCELVFMGKEKRNFLTIHIMWLVDEFDAWNVFPWGEYIWEKFYNRTVNVVSRHTEHHLAELKKNPNFNAIYDLYGFAWAFKVNMIPRGLAWSKVTMFEKSDYEELFGLMSNPNVALISSLEEMSQAWVKASTGFIKGLDDQDGTFFQDDQGREKCIEQHTGMCGDTEDGTFVDGVVGKICPIMNRMSVDDRNGVLDSQSDDGDGVSDSQAKDVDEQAAMLPTMSSNSPQARNAAVSEFFVEFDAFKKEVLLIKRRKDDEFDELTKRFSKLETSETFNASSSSAHPENDEDVSHLDDNMKINGQNVKDGYSNSQHHLHLLIKALGTKIENPSINAVVPPKVDDPMLRTIKPKDDFNEADVDSYDDDYMSLFNDEEQPAKSSLNDLELEQEPNKVDVKCGILEQQPNANKEKTTIIQETLGVTVEEGPSLGRGLGTVKSKKKNCQRALRPNYILRSAQIKKKKMAMSLKSPFGPQSDTTLVLTKRKTRLKKTDDIVLPSDLEDISGQQRIQSINHIMTHDPFVENLSRPDGCKSDKVKVPEYILGDCKPSFLNTLNWDDARLFFKRPYVSPALIAVEKEYFLINEPKIHWCLAELEIRTRVVTFYDSLGWAGGSRRRW